MKKIPDRIVQTGTKNTGKVIQKGPKIPDHSKGLVLGPKIPDKTSPNWPKNTGKDLFK